MPRNFDRDQELRRKRTNEILQNAVELFAKKGLEATRISDIAQKAGMSHGLVYNYFKSKEEIYASLIHINLSSFKEKLEAGTDSGKSPKEILEEIVRNQDFERCEGAEFHQVFEEQLIYSDAVSAELKESLNKGYEEVIKLLTRIIELGIERGEFIPGIAEYHAFYFLTILQGSVSIKSRKMHNESYGINMLSYLLTHN
ncbi:AcrR family transcriptional regulator [Fontibacillus solani]|uniref:AcrR family transcriptional regulator n=1 Tax=Fontibacillus solani TaxID=1572857 RepID=A0A7W3SYF0_9BACL|nr:TetR/AcrR family transcriptional regulator [Fontibacillus solani]MBA9088439.1 AcrR family transcriptional regulator [Fontibacillus solani]